MQTPIEPDHLETHAELKQIAYVRTKIEKNIKGYGSSGGVDSILGLRPQDCGFDALAVVAEVASRVSAFGRR